jgi:hypothetical protein
MKSKMKEKVIQEEEMPENSRGVFAWEGDAYSQVMG